MLVVQCLNKYALAREPSMLSLVFILCLCSDNFEDELFSLTVLLCLILTEI